MPLKYVFTAPPASGRAIEIVPGVKWVRSPLPLTLNHINCYLLKDGDGWCVVDTGMNSDAARDQWREVFANELEGAPITRVIGTHHHPDHIGLAGWLCDEWRVPLYMTEREYYYTRTYAAPRRSDAYWETDQFFARAGMAVDSRKELFSHSDFQHMTSEPPGSYHQIKDRQTLRIGDYDWQAVTTRGHAPEHLSLYCAELHLLLSGDQVLPKITPNINVSPSAPEDNPLADWFESNRKMIECVPDNVKILPSHQLPFTGLHHRVRAIVEHHHERLDALVNLCDNPVSAQDITRQLFARELNAFQNFLAVGECLAHLHYLLDTGRVTRALENDVWLYRRVDYVKGDLSHD